MKAGRVWRAILSEGFNPNSIARHSNRGVEHFPLNASNPAKREAGYCMATAKVLHITIWLTLRWRVKRSGGRRALDVLRSQEKTTHPERSRKNYSSLQNVLYRTM